MAKRTFIRNLLSLKKRRKFGVHHFQVFSSPFTENSLVKCEISLPPCISKWAACNRLDFVESEKARVLLEGWEG